MLQTKISLIPAAYEDLDTILAIERSSENFQYVGHWKRSQHEAAISNLDIAHLKVVVENEIVGYLILVGIINPDKSIQLKRIAIEQKGCGFGRQAIRLAKKMVFDRLKAHRFWLDVMVHNKRAYTLYRSEGFIEEGIIREAIKQQDCFIDLKLMSILEQEYKSKRLWVEE